MQKKTRLVLIVALLIPIAAMLAAPAKFTASVGNGFKLFAVSVLPALFPFFFFSKLLTGLGAAEDLSRGLSRPTAFLFRTPPSSAYIFAMSIICGYPVGAHLCRDLYERGELSTEEVCRTTAFCSTSGPMFILGTVGGFLADARAGYIILVAHYAGALLNGLLYRAILRAKRKRQESATTARSTVIVPGTSLDNLLGESMNNSVLSIAAVGGFVAVFSMLIDLLGAIGVFSAAYDVFSGLPNEAAELASTLLIGSVEMTRGSFEVSASAFTLPLKTALCAFFAAFGGTCVIMQTFASLSECKVKFGTLLFQKTTQGLLTFLLTYPLALAIL